MTHVPFVDLRAQTRELHDELHEVFESVLSRAAYTMGPELGEFEAAFAAFCGAEHCAGVSSGTDAVRLALQAAGVGPGDEVIVPVNTFMASAEALSHCGAVPMVVDVEAATVITEVYVLAEVREECEGTPSALMPTHSRRQLWGPPPDEARL